MDRDAEERRLARANWPIRRVPLGEKTSEIIVGKTPSELFAMVHQLTLDAWAMSGKPMPTYSRAEIPIRILRRR